MDANSDASLACKELSTSAPSIEVVSFMTQPCGLIQSRPEPSARLPEGLVGLTRPIGRALVGEPAHENRQKAGVIAECFFKWSGWSGVLHLEREGWRCARACGLVHVFLLNTGNLSTYNLPDQPDQ